MHDSMKMGDGCPMGFGRSHAGIPLIPAPVAMVAMMFGIMIGVMIGMKKSMMMHGSMGHGAMMMQGSGTGSQCGGGDWMGRKKMMMGKMAMHHHHGDGTPGCMCGEGEQGAGEWPKPSGEE